jgi:acetylornithine deacetylase
VPARGDRSGGADAAVDLARELIAIPTVSRDSNLALIDFVAAHLRRHDVDHAIQYDPDGRKANLLAAIGPLDRPGIILAGHTDVVPVDGQAWSTDPFDPVIRDGRIYGRGSCDMKGFLAAALAGVVEMRRRRLETPVHLVLTYDEEVGCHGAREAAGMMAARLAHRSLACIVGEPTGMAIVDGHRGIHLLRTTVRGTAGHSGAVRGGVNSIAVMARLACYLTETCGHAHADPAQAAGDAGSQELTLNLGRIRGGTAINIVPEVTELEWEYRYWRPQDEGRVLRDLRDFCGGLLQHAGPSALPQISTDEIAAVPPLSGTANAELAAFLCRLTGADRGRPAEYCTEGGLYQARLGVPTVICGPGSIAQAHRPDEYLELSELARAVAFIDALATACESGAWMTLAAAAPPGTARTGDPPHEA